MLELHPTKGKLLIADPSMRDTSFVRTVILLTEHNKSGSVGFILNRPLGFSLKDIIPDFDCEAELYNGGPVEQDNLYFIHRSPELIPNSIEISNGIYWGGDFPTVKNLINSSKLDLKDIKFFLGYSGWSADQLILELREKSWLISNSNNGLLEQSSNNFWKRMMKEQGGVYQIWANAPLDPSMN